MIRSADRARSEPKCIFLRCARLHPRIRRWKWPRSISVAQHSWSLLRCAHCTALSLREEAASPQRHALERVSVQRCIPWLDRRRARARVCVCLCVCVCVYEKQRDGDEGDVRHCRCRSGDDVDENESRPLTKDEGGCSLSPSRTKGERAAGCKRRLRCAGKAACKNSGHGERLTSREKRKAEGGGRGWRVRQVALRRTAPAVWRSYL